MNLNLLERRVVREKKVFSLCWVAVECLILFETNLVMKGATDNNKEKYEGSFIYYIDTKWGEGGVLSYRYLQF